MKIGDVIQVKPESFSWNSAEKTINGQIGNVIFSVPKSELSMQEIDWSNLSAYCWIHEIIVKGFKAVVKEVTPNGERILSIKEWQKLFYNTIYEGRAFRGKIIAVTRRRLLVDVETLIVAIWATDCSRSRMNNLQNFFKCSESVRLVITRKDNDFPYHVNGSRKDAYVSLSDNIGFYRVGKWIDVMATERLNEDGYRVEVTPGIPGLINGPKELLDKIPQGKRLRAKILYVGSLGLKCWTTWREVLSTQVVDNLK